MDFEGTRVEAEQWPLGPGTHANTTQTEDIIIGEPTRNPAREEAIKQWVKYYKETITTLPHARLFNKFLPEALLERGNPNDGGRPLRACMPGLSHTPHVVSWCSLITPYLS
jgi:hypothetical protein